MTKIFLPLETLIFLSMFGNILQKESSPSLNFTINYLCIFFSLESLQTIIVFCIWVSYNYEINYLSNKSNVMKTSGKNVANVLVVVIHLEILADML